MTTRPSKYIEPTPEEKQAFKAACSDIGSVGTDEWVERVANPGGVRVLFSELRRLTARNEALERQIELLIQSQA